MLLKDFYKSSRIFASEQGRQNPKINKRGRGGGLIRSGRGWGRGKSKIINGGERLFGTYEYLNVVKGFCYEVLNVRSLEDMRLKVPCVGTNFFSSQMETTVGLTYYLG